MSWKVTRNKDRLSIVSTVDLKTIPESNIKTTPLKKTADDHTHRNLKNATKDVLKSYEKYRQSSIVTVAHLKERNSKWQHINLPPCTWALPLCPAPAAAWARRWWEWGTQAPGDCSHSLWFPPCSAQLWQHRRYRGHLVKQLIYDGLYSQEKEQNTLSLI